MKRAMTIIRFTGVVAAVWLVGAADWPVDFVLEVVFGSGGCC